MLNNPQMVPTFQHRDTELIKSIEDMVRSLNPNTIGRESKILSEIGSKAEKHFISQINTNSVVNHIQRGTEDNKIIEMRWEGTLDDFDKDEYGAREWRHSPSLKVVGNSITKTQNKIDPDAEQGTFVKIGDHVFRPLLVEAKVIAAQNTTPHTIGVKIEGMPINSEVISNSSKDYNVVIYPSTTPSPVKIPLFHCGANWRDYASAYSGLSEKAIEDTIAGKDPFFWAVTEHSPILYRLREKNPAFLEMATPIPTESYGQCYLISANEGNWALEQLKTEIKSLPFCNPFAISATIHREDGKRFSDSVYKETKIGTNIQDAYVASPKARQNREIIALTINAKYTYVPVGQ